MKDTKMGIGAQIGKYHDKDRCSWTLQSLDNLIKNSDRAIFDRKFV
jgi:hypothetical protein